MLQYFYMNIFLFKKEKAFTLIELLVVIAIIGILASVVIASLNSARGKARDARRISDMKALQTAVEMYYADNGDYPGTGHHSNFPSTACISSTSWTTPFNADFLSKYIPALPSDPNGVSAEWCYSYSKVGSSAVTCTIGGVSTSFSDYEYVLTFKAENNLNDKYPIVSSAHRTNAYCILGPRK